MTATYHISPDELNEDFLQKLKQTFGEKKLLITIEEDDDDTFFLLCSQQNRNKFKQSLKELNEGDLVTVSIEDLRK
jgi:hypothetical protein